ncbi:growth arrest and DNA-damage-inducible, beta b [Neoarius graeffei]|uniref:growth arrest and DNA-damage-inducible, beta b n=1 Tax=Neoarius graeffei TaxID=443677 RepID=UPI00298CE8AD|nr:growth arrest and DNA-damage-inducible, beta b [Neoarius graeffei]
MAEALASETRAEAEKRRARSRVRVAQARAAETAEQTEKRREGAKIRDRMTEDVADALLELLSAARRQDCVTLKVYELKDLHCVLVTNPQAEHSQLSEVGWFCQENLCRNQWLPHISLEEQLNAGHEELAPR